MQLNQKGLSKLAYLTTLQFLRLHSEFFFDMAKVESIPALKELDLSGAGTISLPLISKFNNLSYLVLRKIENSRDLMYLENLKNLKTLALHIDFPNAFEFFPELPPLKFLRIRDCSQDERLGQRLYVSNKDMQTLADKSNDLGLLEISCCNLEIESIALINWKFLTPEPIAGQTTFYQR